MRYLLSALILVFLCSCESSETRLKREKQIKAGTDYFALIDDNEVHSIIQSSKELIELTKLDSASWVNYGEFDENKVPANWQEIGVQGIRVSSNKVSYYFYGGGPISRTLLEVNITEECSEIRTCIHDQYTSIFKTEHR